MSLDMLLVLVLGMAGVVVQVQVLATVASVAVLHVDVLVDRVYEDHPTVVPVHHGLQEVVEVAPVVLVVQQYESLQVMQLSLKVLSPVMVDQGPMPLVVVVVDLSGWTVMS